MLLRISMNFLCWKVSKCNLEITSKFIFHFVRRVLKCNFGNLKIIIYCRKCMISVGSLHIGAFQIDIIFTLGQIVEYSKLQFENFPIKSTQRLNSIDKIFAGEP